MSTGNEILLIDTDQALQKIIQRMENLDDALSAPDVLAKTLNSVARNVRRQIKKDALERYAVTKQQIFDAPSEGKPKLRSATGGSLEAVLESTGPMQEIMSFIALPNMGTGAAAAKVLNSGSLKALEVNGLKAFLARFSNRHTAIVQRKGDDRLPVKKLLSPAVPHMLGSEEVREKAYALAVQKFDKQLDKFIDKALAK